MKPLRVDDANLTVGTVLLGKYQVDSILGTGGMGVVAKCTHLGLDEPVAIKLLRPDARLDGDSLARFIREAQAAVKLKSEHVARVSDVGTLENGLPYMVMEFLAGMDLGEWIAAQGPVSPPLAVNLIVQACEALAEAHSLGIVHRDVKPTNLFVSWRPDGSPLIKVLDFGISKSMSGAGMSLTQTASLLGSPAYMSPEQMRSARTVDARTDIWSLGAVIYEAIEARRPFWADSFAELCVKVTLDPPEPMTVATPELAAVIMRALEKNPTERYATVAEFAAGLAPFARDPAEALRLVARMQRMLGRRSATPAAGEWTDPSATYRVRDGSRAATPVPTPVAAPIATAAPSVRRASVPAGQESGPETIPENHEWSQQTLDELARLGLANSITRPVSDAAAPATIPGPTSPLAALPERTSSVTGSTQLDTRAAPPSRRWLWMGLVAAGLIVGSVAFGLTRGSGDPTAPATVPTPAGHGVAPTATATPDAGIADAIVVPAVVVPVDAAPVPDARPTPPPPVPDAGVATPHVERPTRPGKPGAAKPGRPTKPACSTLTKEQLMTTLCS